MKKQTYIPCVVLRCADLDNNYEQLVEHFAKLRLEAEAGFDDDELCVRPAEVDIDADLLREIAKYDIEEIAIEAGDCVDTVCARLEEFCQVVAEPDEWDLEDVAFDGWNTQSSFRILCKSADIEKIIDVLF